MQTIVEALTKALQSDEPLAHTLNQNSTLVWQANYPVAIVHEKHRIQEEEIIGALESAELFLEGDLTPTHYNNMMIDFFRNNASPYLKQVSFMCLADKLHTSYTFHEKRPHDYWKKVQNPGNFKAVIERSAYNNTHDICHIEKHLRDIMRRNKEVPSLKEIGFVWVAQTPSILDIRELLQHYFAKNYTMLVHDDQVLYIGWSDTLNKINMRHFICPPN